MIIDAISDLHGEQPDLGKGDLLILAGDLTSNDTPRAWEDFFYWLSKQNYSKKIFISGNHDNQAMSQFDWGPNTDYLCDYGIEYKGLKIWGSPWSLWFNGINPHCKAFTGTERDLCKKYEKIPKGLDILISHGPPFMINDTLSDGRSAGSLSLRTHIEDKLPKIVICGHIHEQGGKKHRYYPPLEELCSKEGESEMLTTVDIYNVSCMNENYELVRGATRI